MKKYLRFIEWIPFSICLGSLIIYLLYTLHIKLHPEIIVTDKLVSTLKFYLIIALVSLFIGLLIVLIKKLYYLNETNVVTNNDKVKVTTETYKTVKQNDLSYSKVVDPVIVEKTVKEEVVEEKNKNIDNKAYCPECDEVISKKAAICPHCGIIFDKEILRVLKKHDKRKKRRPLNPFWVVINLILIVILIILIIIVSKALYNRIIINNKNINPFKIVER